MKRKSLTYLLLKARDEGLSIEVDGGDLAVSPGGRISPELRDELIAHKPELVEYLEWGSDERACQLVRDALEYLAVEYIRAELPDYDSGLLEGPERAIDEAYAARDMFALRVAVREWVRVGVAAFGAKERDRGAA